MEVLKSDRYVYKVQPIEGPTVGTIEIPPLIIADGDIDDALKLNNKVIRKLHGNPHTWYCTVQV